MKNWISVDSPSYLKLAYLAKQRSEQMYTTLVPDNIKILFDDSFYIRRYEKNEFLYEDSEIGPERHISTGIYEMTSKDERAEWCLESMNNGHTFRIRNVYFDDYLYSENLIDEEKRSVLGYKENEMSHIQNSEFTIHPEHDGAKFIIKNSYGEVMYASNLLGDSRRRKIVCWTPKYELKAYWSIVKCPFT